MFFWQLVFQWASFFSGVEKNMFDFSFAAENYPLVYSFFVKKSSEEK